MSLLTPKLEADPIWLLPDVEVVVPLPPTSGVNFMLIGLFVPEPVFLVPLNGELFILDDLLQVLYGPGPVNFHPHQTALYSPG